MCVSHLCLHAGEVSTSACSVLLSFIAGEFPVLASFECLGECWHDNDV